MVVAFPEPTDAVDSRSAVLVGYLDFFRARIVETVAALSARDARTSRLPSGWAPLELAKHLTWVELRWLDWRFEGRDVDDPWGDERDRRWYVPPEETVDGVLAALVARGEITRAIIARHSPDDVGVPGERWDGAPPATLERVLLHLLQEYARHVGHLDIAAELAGGPTGE